MVWVAKESGLPKQCKESNLSSTSTQKCLQSLGQAMVNMQRQQEHLFEQMKLDFATKLADQDERNMREMEALRSDLGRRGDHQREREYIDHTVKYIDECTRTDGRVIPKPKPSRGGLGAGWGSRGRGRAKGAL